MVRCDVVRPVGARIGELLLEHNCESECIVGRSKFQLEPRRLHGIYIYIYIYRYTSVYYMYICTSCRYIVGLVTMYKVLVHST